MAIDDIRRFRTDLSALHASLNGAATLAGLEPNLRLTLTGTSRGGIAAVVEITPDHLTQQHRFAFEADQSYLPALIAGCDRILDRL